MKPLETLYGELRSIDLREDGTVPQFESVLAAIGAREDSSSIVELTRFFDDDCEYDEAMFSIVHLIETFDDDHYIAKLLESSPTLCDTAPRWASIIFMRILNSESSMQELVRQVRISSPEVKNSIRVLMEKINVRSVKFLAKTAPVLIAAEI